MQRAGVILFSISRMSSLDLSNPLLMSSPDCTRECGTNHLSYSDLTRTTSSTNTKLPVTTSQEKVSFEINAIVTESNVPVYNITADKNR